MSNAFTLWYLTTLSGALLGGAFVVRDARQDDVDWISNAHIEALINPNRIHIHTHRIC